MSSFFTYQQRLLLQKYLTAGNSFKEIASLLQKDPTTISREVRNNLSLIASGKPGYPYNPCKNRVHCRRKNVCAEKDPCTRKSVSYCKLCSKCNDHCPDFVEEVCSSRFRAPYVCNGCNSIGQCTLRKNIYDAAHAEEKTHERLSQSRSGLCTSEADLKRLNDLISPLILRGQSLHQIFINHREEIMCSEKTLYTYVDSGFFDIRNGDLPRKKRLRPRKKKKEFKVDKGCRIGRNYQDFQLFMQEHPDTPVVQMDSVIGSVGGKCLLTIHFVSCGLMLAFLREANTAQSVTDIFTHLYESLGDALFQKLFPVILTDNGSEFSDPVSIECDKETGMIRSRVFYCDAGSPYQKGSIEVNHELIRRVLEGKDGRNRSFNDLTQEDVTLMMNHINSYKRKKLNDRSPYETFSFCYGEEVLQKLGCSSVPPDEVTLKPSLLAR